MSTPTALAPAGNENPGALAALADGILTPSPATPATPAPATPATPQAPTAASTEIVVGGQTYTPERAQSLIAAGLEATRIQSEAQAQLEQLGDAQFVYQIIQNFNEQEVHYLLDAIEDVKAARETGAPLGQQSRQIEAFDPPQDYKPVRSSEMSDEAATVYEMVAGLRNEMHQMFRKVTGTIQGMQSWAQGQTQISQDEQTARAMSEKLGYAVTPATVREWRANGMNDPVKWIESQGIAKPAPAAATVTPPPEAPASSDSKTFDGNANWSAIQLTEFAEKGMLPEQPELVENFKKHFGLAA